VRTQLAQLTVRAKKNDSTPLCGIERIIGGGDKAAALSAFSAGDQMRSIPKLVRVAAMMAAGFCFASVAFAATPVCPERYIRMVIPQPAGGVGDMIGRLLGDKVAQVLGQPMVYENIPGATTTIGTAAAARAKPDGCTILHLTTSGVVASAMRD